MPIGLLERFKARRGETHPLKAWHMRGGKAVGDMAVFYNRTDAEAGAVAWLKATH
jgi:hypothetical protein